MVDCFNDGKGREKAMAIWQYRFHLVSHRSNCPFLRLTQQSKQSPHHDFLSLLLRKGHCILYFTLISLCLLSSIPISKGISKRFSRDAYICFQDICPFLVVQVDALENYQHMAEIKANTISGDSHPLGNYPSILDWKVVLYALLISTAVLAIIFCITKRCLTPSDLGAAPDVVEAKDHEKGSSSGSSKPHKPNIENTGLYGHTGEIVFCDGNKKKGLYNLRFILKSSVEMLGKGSLGSTYKVVLGDGSIVALKRLKEANLKQKDFEQYLNKFGKLQMKNILPVQSYYYSKGLKFVVYDYLCLGSLSSLIQGGKQYNHTPLDWPTRLAIAIDVAHALRNLHNHSIVHGNLKSSNIFLNTDFTTFVSEYSLVQMSSTTLADQATLGYKAPELVDATAPNFQTDVYSFGVLLMELLTGIPPNSSFQQAASSSDELVDGNSLPDWDLPEWVTKTSQEKSTADVFDPELRPTCFETAAVQMLHVALGCVSTLAESRPSMNKVLRMMEHIRSIQERRSNLFSEKMMSDFDTPSDSESHSIGTSMPHDDPLHCIISMHDEV